MNEDKKKLYGSQKILLDTFLKAGIIDNAQYDKSLNSLKKKMGIDESEEQVYIMCITDKEIEELLSSLDKTKFRGSFHLNSKMKEYISTKGISKIESDAYDLINKRIAPKDVKNDGKQTPMKQVHPVFIAQHATGTCCRGCLERIHHIEKNKELNFEEIDYIVKVIIMWIKNEMESKV